MSQAEDLDAPSHTLHSLESAFETMERVAYEPVDDVYNGKPIACQAEAQRIAITDAGKIIAIYERDEKGVYRCKRGLW